MMDTPPTHTVKTKPFSLPLPMDPTRLLLGFRQKWYWFILLPLALGGMGGIAGFMKAEDRYSVSLQLLRAEVPSTIQASEEGTAFRPRELSDETLLAVTYASDVMNAVGASLDPPRSGNAVKSVVEINKQRGTDFFYITAHSRIGAEDAIGLVSSWAAEIVRFTRELQRREASDMLAFLTTRDNEIEQQLKRINADILAFSRESEFYDADQQTESYLSTLENLQMKLAESRIELQSKEIQINRYRQELRNQSPLFEELRRQEKELTFLQGRYTQDNPLVKEKLYEISFLKKQLESLQSGDAEDLKEYTGSDLGNNLYMEILALENEKTQLQRILDSYGQLIEEKQKQVASLPEMQMGLTELTGQRQQLLTAKTMIDARMKEAEFFINNPPGYWKIFQSPELRDVAVSSQPIKAFLLAAVGMIGGLVLAGLIAFLWEFLQPGIRSPLQAAISTRIKPILHFQSGSDASKSILEKWMRLLGVERAEVDNSPELMRYWLMELARPEPRYPVVFFQVIQPSPELGSFWSTFLEIIGQDDVPIVLLPLSKEDRELLPRLDVFAGQRRGGYVDESLVSNPANAEVVLRNLSQQAYAFIISGQRIRPREFKVLQAVDQLYAIISPEVGSSRLARMQTDVIRTIKGAHHGLIILTPVLRQSIPRLLYYLQMSFFYTQKQPEGKS